MSSTSMRTELSRMSDRAAALLVGNCTDVVRRIVAWMMLALILIGALLAWLQYLNTVEQQKHEAEQRARALSVALQESFAADGPGQERQARMQATVDSYAALPPVASISILDDGGRVVADSHRQRIGRRGLSSGSGRLARAIHGVVEKGRPRYFKAGPAGEELSYLVSPAAIGGGADKRGVIVVALDLQAIHRRALQGACQAVVLVIAQILAMWLVVATLLRRLVLAPLQSLAQATWASLETGRFQMPERMPANEVGALALAFEEVFGTLVESQAQARKLALIAARTSNGVVLTDAGGRVEWVNEAFTRTTEYTLDEIRGQIPGHILQGPQSDPHTINHMRAALARGEGFNVDLINYTRSRKPYWVHIEAQPIRDEQGRLTNYMALQSDITNRRRAERELKSYAVRLESTNTTLQKYIVAAEAATQAKSEFLANMSHEIRTPMTAILGYTELLLEEEGAEANSPRAEALRTVHRNGEHLLELINDILDLSKIEAGRLAIERIACHPVELARDVIQLMQLRAESKGLSLSLRFEGSVPHTIRTDPTRLRQVLINLVGNAVKFTEHGGVRVAVRCVTGDGGIQRLQFDVQDTGIGMHPEQIAQLFTPFTQADNSTTRRFGGTGLGLSISKRLAEMLRGTIEVQSAPGEGSLFRLEIEAVPCEAPRETADEVLQLRSRNSARTEQPIRLEGTLLLAEDSVDSQRLLMHVLRAAGADVTLAENGQVALDKALAARAAGCPFDVILMDMQMPVVDGYDATARLRQEGYTGPIIALTAHAMASDREKCLAAGCDDFATKPIERKKLLLQIENLLARPAVPSAAVAGPAT